MSSTVSHADAEELMDIVFEDLVEAAEVNPFAASAHVNGLLARLAEEEEQESEKDEDEDVGEDDSSSGEEDDASEDDDESEDGDVSGDDESEDHEDDAGPRKVHDPLMERVRYLKATKAPLDNEPAHIQLWCKDGPSALHKPTLPEHLSTLVGDVVPVTEYSLYERDEVIAEWTSRKAQRQQKHKEARLAAAKMQREARRKRDKEEALTAAEVFEEAPALGYAVERLRRDVREGCVQFFDITPRTIKGLVAEFYALPEFCTVERALQIAEEKEEDAEVCAFLDNAVTTTGKRKRSPTISITRVPFVLSSTTGVVGRPLRSTLKKDIPEGAPTPPRKCARYASAVAIGQDGQIWPIAEDLAKSIWGRDRDHYAAMIEDMPSELFDLLLHKLEKCLQLDGVRYQRSKRRRVELDFAHAVTAAATVVVDAFMTYGWRIVQS